MIPLTLAEVAEAVGGTPGAPGAADVTVTGAVVTDSRAVERGGLFVAVAGARVDGHDFLGAVLDSGAAGALIDAAWVGSAAHTALLEQHPDAAGRLIAVEDVVPALGALARVALARARRGADAPRVVAITGSVGKTTTKDLLAQVLRDHVAATSTRTSAGTSAGTAAPDPQVAVVSPPGSFNNEIGLPLTVLRTSADTRFLVLEMGADHVGNIEYLTSIAPPDVAVVLAVGRAHLGEFGGIEQVARAKAEMVTGAAPGATGVLNDDDPRVAAMARLTGQGADRPDLTVRTFGRDEADVADVAARGVRLDDAGCAAFDLVTRDGSTPVSLRLVGEHHTANGLAAAAAALALDVDVDEIAVTLGRTGAASAHRMAVTDRPDGVRIVDDAYNANPDSMRAALRALPSLAVGRRTIAVLGEMLELGEESAAEHTELGREVARAGVDVLVAVAPGAAAIADGAAAEDPARAADHAVADVDAARALLDDLVRGGDVVLFKGSNGSGIWRLADAVTGGRA